MLDIAVKLFGSNGSPGTCQSVPVQCADGLRASRCGTHSTSGKARGDAKRSSGSSPRGSLIGGSGGAGNELRLATFTVDVHTGGCARLGVGVKELGGGAVVVQVGGARGPIDRLCRAASSGRGLFCIRLRFLSSSTCENPNRGAVGVGVQASPWCAPPGASPGAGWGGGGGGAAGNRCLCFWASGLCMLDEGCLCSGRVPSMTACRAVAWFMTSARDLPYRPVLRSSSACSRRYRWSAMGLTSSPDARGFMGGGVWGWGEGGGPWRGICGRLRLVVACRGRALK